MSLAALPTLLANSPEVDYSTGSGDACGNQCSITLPISRTVDNKNEHYFIFVRPEDLSWDTMDKNVAFGSAIIYYRR